MVSGRVSYHPGPTVESVFLLRARSCRQKPPCVGHGPLTCPHYPHLHPRPADKSRREVGTPPKPSSFWYVGTTRAVRPTRADVSKSRRFWRCPHILPAPVRWAVDLRFLLGVALFVGSGCGRSCDHDVLGVFRAVAQAGTPLHVLCHVLVAGWQPWHLGKFGCSSRTVDG